jgi:hypothetical protein
MADDCRVVEDAAYFFSQFYTHALSFAARGAPTIKNRIIRVGKNLCSLVNGLFNRDWNKLAVLANQRRLNSMFAFIAQEFGFAHGTAVFNVDDFVVFNC